MLSAPLPVVLSPTGNVRMVVGAVLGPDALSAPATAQFVHHQILALVRMPGWAVSHGRSMRRDGVTT